MKKVIMTIYLVLIIIIIALTIFSLQGRSVRQTELDSATRTAMESAMNMLLLEEGKPESEESWKAAFCEMLAVSISSNSKLQVKFLEVDMEHGLLSVETTLIYNHPIGSEGRVSVVKTAILEEYTKE